MKKKKRTAAPVAASRQPSTRSVLEIANTGPAVSPRSKRVALDRTQSGAAKKGSVEVDIEVGVYAFHSDDTKPYDKGVVQSVSKGWVRLQPPGEDGEAFSVQRSSITAMFKRKPPNWETGKDDIYVAGVLAALPGAVTTGMTDDDRESAAANGDDDGDEKGAHESLSGVNTCAGEGMRVWAVSQGPGPSNLGVGGFWSVFGAIQNAHKPQQQQKNNNCNK